MMVLMMVLMKEMEVLVFTLRMLREPGAGADAEASACHFLSAQRLSSGAEGGVCSVEAAVFGPWTPRGHRQTSDQLLPLPALPVSCHHVAVTL